MNNYYIIRVTGRNINKFLFKCNNNKIDLLKINRISHKEIIIKINEKDYNNLMKIKSIYKLEIINKFGFIKLKELFNRYKILIISFVIGIIFLIFLSNLTFKVFIISDNKNLREKVLRDLNAYGIKKYSYKKRYDDVQKIKKEILEKYSDTIEWIEINRNGIVYKVQIVERKKKANNLNSDNVNIVANKSGVIKKLIIEDGIKEVEINNYVNKGDIVISGILKKDEDIKGLVHAKGKVYAEVWYNVNISYPLNYNEKIYTRNKRKSLYIKIGKKYYNLKKYKNMERKSIIHIANRLVPIEFGIENQNEVKIINDKLSIKEAKNKAILKAKERLLDTLDKDEYIISENTLNFYSKDSKIVVDIFFSCYEEIGMEEKIVLE